MFTVTTINESRKRREEKRISRTPWSTDWISFASGFLGGVMDTALNFIPYGLHYRIQRGEIIDPRINPSIYTPRNLYRGVLSYGTITPVTCIADGVGTLLNKKFGVAMPIATFLSGMLAALVITAPVSNVIIHQQEGKFSPAQSIRHIYKHYGWYRFTTGTSLYLGREGIYSTSIFFMREWLAKQYKIFENKAVNVIFIGFIATILTQPMDTTATCMIKEHTRLTVMETARKMYATEGGLKRFYRGFWFRCYAVVAGIFVMGEMSDFVKRELGEKI